MIEVNQRQEGAHNKLFDSCQFENFVHFGSSVALYTVAHPKDLRPIVHTYSSTNKEIMQICLT